MHSKTEKGDIRLHWLFCDISYLACSCFIFTLVILLNSLPVTNEISRQQLMLINRYVYQSSVNVLQEAGSLGRNKPKFRESDLN